MKTIQIGLTCSPSKILKHTEILAQKVIISYGGGLGGVNRTYYAIKMIDDILDKNFNFLTTIEDREITINKKFIVSIEPVTIVKVVYNNLEHMNYQIKKYKKYIETLFYVILNNEDYVIKNTIDHKSRELSVYSDVVKESL